MPLVKHGKIANDALVQVADDAEIPGDGSILITAARFLEDAEVPLANGRVRCPTDVNASQEEAGL